MLATLALSLALALPAKAGTVGKLDPPPPVAWTELKADPGPITVLTAPDASRWVPVDDGCDLRPSVDGKTAAFAASKPGRYRVLVVPPEGGVIYVAVLVGDAPPPPDPVPPPKPPGPVDPLTAKLQIGYDADPRPVAAKRADVLNLIELYKQAATLAAVADVATTGDLVSRVKDAAKLLGVTGLEECRKTVAGELLVAFPVDEAFTDVSRKRAADLFAKIGESLKAVK